MAGKLTHFLFIFFSSLLFHKTSARSASNEKQILLNIKNDWGNPLSLNSWDLTGDHCKFAGINCSGDGFVHGIELDKSNISFPIPASICDLKGLTFLDLSDNNIPGEFPTVLYNCSKLQELDISWNNFVGELPADIYNMPSNLTLLYIAGNNFTGDIPPGIGRLPAIKFFDFTENLFNGTIPVEMGNLSTLETLYLANNPFSPAKILPEFGNLTSLTYLWMSNMNLLGEIPKSIGKLANLEELDLEMNSLVGEIQASGWMIKPLKILYLNANKLTGELSSTVVADWLVNIDLSENQLTGSIPEHLCDGKALTFLDASDNHLTGKLPESLVSCHTLSFLALSGNKFTGTLPEKLPYSLQWLLIQNNRFSGRIPSSPEGLLVFLGDNNNFSGNLSASLTELSLLRRLSLSRNQISGEIPPEIKSLKYLGYLDLSNNQLSGQIPYAMGFMILYKLDLSNNQLSGEIPSNLGEIPFNSLNLSFNNLTGEIPIPLQIEAYEKSFLSNPNLCASNSNFSIQICKKNRSKKISTDLLILFSILGALIFSGVVLRVLLSKERRRRKIATPFPSHWKLTTFQVINFNEFDILSSLTDDNLVGSGGGGKVYRVSPNLDNTVAVKKIHNTAKFDFILAKQFEAEVKILGSIRHDNIVKLLYCISSENSKLLVYEYLENSSLDRWLHRHRRGSAAPLDWPTRLQIAIGAAQGLCYMHHHCFPPIIHRDVKSSNILLDHKFNAKIADFGLARILHKGGEPESVSAVAGSFGYMAPESRILRKVDEKVDVYSFGVVLFELVTGKEARDGGEIEYENLTDWAWRRYKDKGPVVDEEITEESTLEWVKEAEMMFKVGLICTVCNPAERPTMNEVVRMLMMLGCSNSVSNGGGGGDINSIGEDIAVGVQVVDIMEDTDDSLATQYERIQSPL